jgi:hypothetical protein
MSLIEANVVSLMRSANTALNEVKLNQMELVESYPIKEKSPMQI